MEMEVQQMELVELLPQIQTRGVLWHDVDSGTRSVIVDRLADLIAAEVESPRKTYTEGVNDE